MMKARHLAALLPLLCLAAAPLRSLAGPLDVDAGLRGSIYDDKYDLGKGGELGILRPASPAWDLGLHLNFSHYPTKVPDTYPSVKEYGGYVAAYFRPAIEQVFSLRLGPHIGYAKISGSYLDLGGDVMVIFKTTPALDIYAAFIPSFMIGKNAQTLVRVGVGVEYHTGK